MKPDVSIIVPVYNVEKYLKRCIDSLKNQTLKNIEIILVNDQSTDASPEICESETAKDSRIKVIHKVNEGAGMARNAALKIATGKYIGFVDSDDFVDPKMFETLYDTAEKYNSDFIMSGVLFEGGNMFKEERECVKKTYFDEDTHFETKEELKKLKLGIVGSLPGDEEDSKYGMGLWKNLYKHEIIKKNNLLFQSEREMLSEDALFLVDYISCIQKATGINEAFYSYCRNGDSISKSYKKDRFDKGIVFVGEVEKRLKKDCSQQEYQLYTDRFWQSFLRVVCCQEVMHADDNNISYSDLRKRLKSVCTHKWSERVLKTYPIAKLPLKQMVFAYAMKYKMYFVLKCLVRLRNR